MQEPRLYLPLELSFAASGAKSTRVQLKRSALSNLKWRDRESGRPGCAADIQIVGEHAIDLDHHTLDASVSGHQTRKRGTSDTGPGSEHEVVSRFPFTLPESGRDAVPITPFGKSLL